jgi:hypothetical protein
VSYVGRRRKRAGRSVERWEGSREGGRRMLSFYSGQFGVIKNAVPISVNVVFTN